MLAQSLPVGKIRLPVRTDRLTLRLPHLSDVPELVHLFRVREITRPVAFPHPYTTTHGRSFVRMARKMYRFRTGLPLTITITGSSRPIGGIGLDKFSVVDRRAHIGYWLGRPYWGNGYATEAASAVCGIAFEKFGLHRLETWVAQSNPRSSAVLGRLGFRLEGQARQRSVQDGKPVDDLLNGLLVSEFRPFTLKP